jgi:hypothetical protein
MMGEEVTVTFGDGSGNRGGGGRVAFPPRERGEGEESLGGLLASGYQTGLCDGVDW